MIRQVVDVHRRVHPPRAVLEGLDGWVLTVVLVGDLTDDFLRDVLDGDQASRAAVLVDDDRDVHPVALHLLEQVIGRLAVRHIRGRPHHILHRDGRPGRIMGDPPRDVLEVEHPDDVVSVLTNHRDPRVARPQKQIQALTAGLVAIDDHHVGARNHHFPGDRVPEVDDAVDHPSLVGLDEFTVARDVDEGTQLGLARERSVAKTLARRHRIADQNEQRRHRSEHPAQPHCHWSGDECIATTVLRADGPRGHPDDDERHDRHDRDRQRETRPRLIDLVDDDEGHHDGGGHLSEHADEGQECHVCRAVTDHLDERLRPRSFLSEQFVGTHRRDATQRGLAGGREEGQRDGHDGQDDEAGQRMARSDRSATAGEEGEQQGALQVEHLLLLLGLGVIEAQQVQDAVGREQ